MTPETSGEHAGLVNIGEERCKNLRWKGLFIEAAWDPTVPRSNDRAFWCQHTYNCLGPDSKLADDYECNPARKCYEAL
jgi:hypothetical protein